MLFQSPYAALRVSVRPQIAHYHPVSGVRTGETKRLVAEFAQFGDEFQVDTIDGPVTTVDIHGHFYDSDVAAELNGWTAEEKEAVEARCLYLCRTAPWQIKLVERSLMPPAEPWPKYDSLSNFKKIATLAAELGLVQEAYDYELQTKNREGLVNELRARLADVEGEKSLTATGG